MPMRRVMQEAHERGRVMSGNTSRFVPKEYRRFIGVVPDETLHMVTNNRDRISPQDVDDAVAASNGSKQIMTYLLKTIRDVGVKRLRRKSTDDFIGKLGIGKLKLDALVAFGVEDRRVRRKPFTQFVSGEFVGTIDGASVEGHIEGSYTSDRSRDTRV